MSNVTASGGGAPPPARVLNILAKIERAKEHVRDLESRVRAFLETKPYALVPENDPKTRDRTYRVRIRAPVPATIPVIIGEALYQLRSGLDHLAWQLVEAAGNTPDKSTYFPISETAAKYKADSPGKVKGIDPRAVGVIDALQPYQGGNEAFWWLHKLNNIDKHCLLLVAGCGSSIPIMRVAFGHPNPKGATWVGGHGPTPEDRFAMLQDGAVMGIVHNCGEEEVGTDFQATFEVAFAEPEIVKGQPVVPLLHQLTGLLDSTVKLFFGFL